MRSKENQPQSIGRRSFLKGSSLAVAGVAVPRSFGSARSTQLEQPPATPRLLEAPNLLQGTSSTYLFSRGNTLPITARPFGMAHWTIQSAEETSWMFHPEDRRIQGLRCTHQLSPWLADYGHAVFLPFCGTINPAAGPRSSSWRPEKAVLQPHSLQLHLMRYNADVELVPTERGCIITTQFANHETSGFLIEVPEIDSVVDLDAGRNRVRFISRANHGGVPVNFGTYYIVEFAQAWSSFEKTTTPHSTILLLHFTELPQASIEARVATSFISFDQASRNLAQELGGKSMKELRDEAAAHWSSYTNRIEITGGSPRQRQTFSSCLYRALLFPRLWHEPDHEGKPQHFSPYTGKVLPGVMYADHGYWDVYRAWYPLMSILYPEKLGEILQSWVNAYTEGGWMPQFPCPGYRACMTGSLIDAVFADAAVKEVPGFDLKTAYEGLRKHAIEPGEPDQGYGRRGIESYLKYGYVAADEVKQSVAETADAAYGDFCIAQIAKRLTYADDAKLFTQRSANWRHLFDPKTGFLRGKTSNGKWLDPFDEFQWGSPYVEASAWQHRWDVPHDIDGLIEAMGGNSRAVEALDLMLTLPPVFHVGVYGQEIHEMSEMAAADFGQYAHGNQPVHHLLYIFAAAGRPDRTQFWVRRVLNELYSPEAFPGDEDTGSMAAWYILSAIGFYPLCPGKPEYVLGSPLFDRVTLRLPGDKVTTISARNQGENAGYVSSISVDGQPHTSPYMSHSTIMRGSRLEFVMRSTPASSTPTKG
jgi:predicted alpha-1,2-mannosidase